MMMHLRAITLASGFLIPVNLVLGVYFMAQGTDRYAWGCLAASMVFATLALGGNALIDFLNRKESNE
jgi:hypothetical protein